MSSKQKHALSKVERAVPQLRFPEFEEQWEREMLGNKKISFFPSNKTPKNELEIKTYVSTENLLPDYGGVKKSSKLPDSGSFTSFQKGDILIANIRPYLKKVWFADRSGAASNDVIVFRNGSTISEDYLQHILKNDLFINYVMKGAKGVKMPRGDKSLMKKYPVYFPKNPKEQQKIANCLSSLDALITAETEKRDLLQDHKKGLLQQLFPNPMVNGETMVNDETHNSQFTIHNSKVPKFRFPEFVNDGEWEIEPLNNVYSFKITNSFSRDKLNYENGSVKNIHYGDIHTKFSTHFDILKEDVPFINPEISIDRIDNDNYCKEGDLVIADASEDIDDIGKSIEIINLNKEKLLAGLHTFLARPINSKITIGFGGHLFKSSGIVTQIKKEAQGAKVLGISKGRLANLDVYFPSNPAEQQKIAACLSAADALIEAQTQKIEALQEHKKGLLQQMFPNHNP